MSYTALATITLGSNTSSVTFSSIPNTFKDLVLVARMNATTNTLQGMRFNSDSGNNYNNNVMVASTVVGGGAGFNVNAAYLMQNTTPNGGSIQSHVTIFDYAQTDKHKHTLIRYFQTNVDNSGVNYVGLTTHRWASTNALTTITIIDPFYAGNVLAAGSTYSLYGIS